MSNRSILVVDDDSIIRFAHAKVFANAGYEAKTAESAEHALQIMRTTPAAILFLDLSLPAMNGVDLCRAVHKDWPWRIAIAVTGHASLFELVKCREAGFEDYFIKRVGSKDLLKAAEHACNKLERWKQRQVMPPHEAAFKLLKRAA